MTTWESLQHPAGVGWPYRGYDRTVDAYRSVTNWFSILNVCCDKLLLDVFAFVRTVYLSIIKDTFREWVSVD